MLPLTIDVETKAVLKQVNLANRKLAELKGLEQLMPNEEILIQTLTLQEAQESSRIENIVTTQDELYRAGLDLKDAFISAATKEVMRYREAIRRGFELIRHHKLLTNNIILEIQEILEENQGGFRQLPGTVLKNQQGETVYTPPQDGADVLRLMQNLEQYINTPEMQDVDPLIKLAIIHYQFESIHPFYDGNGRTGRILCVLYLITNQLLDLPILYLSRYITRNKEQYYHLLQNVRCSENAPEIWEQWILYMLKGIEETAEETVNLVKEITRLMADFKKNLRETLGKSYSHELLNCLFISPYTKVEHLERRLGISRPTATKHLDSLVQIGLLDKTKIWRQNYYINKRLVALLAKDDSVHIDTGAIVQTLR
ncbi:MAG: Fic family protein [Akkermansia sp.]|nr:Fic family protein [Akkermansia sp.]